MHAAVEVMTIYLSYGDAQGTTRVAIAVIDLGMGNRKRVWSSYGGTWHRVRVRYPKFWPRYGKTAPRLIGRGLFAAGLGIAVLYALGRVPTGGGVVRRVGLFAGAILLGDGLYVLVR